MTKIRILLCGSLPAIALSLAIAQTPPTPADPATAQDLTHEEKTTLENFRLKLELGSKDAMMIKQAYEQNQARMHSLVDEEQGFMDQVCFNHKIPAAKCQISADGSKVQLKEPAKPAASAPPAAKK